LAKNIIGYALSLMENGVVTACRDNPGLNSLGGIKTTNASAMPKRQIAINQRNSKGFLQIHPSSGKNTGLFVIKLIGVRSL